jgi:hypothetical protein
VQGESQSSSRRTAATLVIIRASSAPRGHPNLRLQRPALRPDHLAADSTRYPRAAGQHNKNPDPAFRQRLLCGLTILHGLQPAGLDHWNSGWLYNSNDGQTYRVSAELHSADVFVARIYLGVPLFGETKTPAAGPAAQVGRLLLTSLERVVHRPTRRR